jgi:hypothetical protein
LIATYLACGCGSLDGTHTLSLTAASNTCESYYASYSERTTVISISGSDIVQTNAPAQIGGKATAINVAIDGDSVKFELSYFVSDDGFGSRYDESYMLDDDLSGTAIGMYTVEAAEPCTLMFSVTAQ